MTFYNKYCEVAVNTGTRQTDRLFTYKIPKGLLEKVAIGSKVVVPFGLGNKLLEGYVFNLKTNTDFKNLKSISYVLENDVSLTKSQIELCNWLRETYLCTYLEAITPLIPTGTSLKRNKIYYICNKEEDIYLNDLNLSKNQIKIIKFIKNNHSANHHEIVKEIGPNCNRELKKLIDKKIICFEESFYTDVSTKYKKVVELNFSPDMKDEIMEKLSKRAFKQIEVLKFLLDNNNIDLRKLLLKTKASRSTISSLEKKGLVIIKNQKDFRTPIDYKSIQQESHNTLNSEQKEVYKKISSSMKSNISETFLIHGVTGSGKTEVYIKLVQDVLSKGEQAIILVPEISLTPQILNKFVKVFGKKVAVLHSKLSLGERFDQWKKIKNNEIPIVIGARSAIFAPCNNIGLVIIDEEHESSYKSETNPKYNTIEVGKFICRKKGIPLVLGTATPSVESYYKTLNNNYNLLELKERFNKNPMPSIKVVDMRKELEEGNKSMFSRSLFNGIKENLDNKKQTILFLNRRGHSTFISCRSCGFVLKCKDCDISLTYHQKGNTARCHYCGYRANIPKICPSCGSKYIKYFGSGTEKVEGYVKKVFPSAAVKRLDMDTTARKGELEKIIKSLESRKTDILIGTQMVTKGLDFPYVTLVGVLSADLTLNLPDYRANERTFQLLTQVAGRAGRHDFKGKVIVQTYSPDNYAINTSKRYDYKNFFNNELNLREEFLYPPFYELINIIIYGENERSVIKSSNNLSDQLKSSFHKEKNKVNDIIFLGPNPAIYNKVKKNYRWQILIKHKSIDRKIIKDIINNICNINRNKIIDNNVYLSIDINPYNIF